MLADPPDRMIPARLVAAANLMVLLVLAVLWLAGVGYSRFGLTGIGQADSPAVEH